MKPAYNKELSLEEIATMPDEKIDYSDITELDAFFGMMQKSFFHKIIGYLRKDNIVPNGIIFK